MYREKINEFINSVSKSNDIDALDLINDVIDSATEYIKRVNNLEAARMTAKITSEPAEYREIIQKLDRLRSSAHNSLIANVKALNRLCRAMGIILIYEGDEEKRIEIAEFARELTDEIFDSRVR